MLGRKAKKPATQDQGRDQRRSRPVQSQGPAFSYYSSRTPESTLKRQQQREQAAQVKRTPVRRWAAIVPALLLLTIALVCGVKLLLLGTNPKIIMLDRSSVSAAYVQPTAVYETAAQRLLASSITNRTKATANLDGVAAKLQAQFPELQAVSLTLPLIGNRPIVYVQVAQPSVIVQAPAGNYALNSSGLTLAKVGALPAGIPLLVDQSGSSPQTGKRYLPGSTISFVRTVAYQANAAHLTVTAYVLPAGKPYELDVRLEGKPFIVRYNLAGDALKQSGAAIATLQQLGAVTPSSYLDVRVSGRAYYR